MVASRSSFATMVASAALIASVQGHGYMSDPAVEFTINGDTTQFMATIESSATGWSGKFDGSPADNTAAFTTAFATSTYSSLKELVTDLGQLVSTEFTTECGYTNPDETPQPLPETYVEWSHSSSEGFTASHEGPCEVWCDDVRVFQDDDCAADYTTAPAELPYDRDACLGAERLTFYWLALHSSTWQVYTNCAALETTTSTGATSKYAVGGSSSSTAAEATTEAPAATKEAPAATTEAPAATTEAPAATTEAPAATTEAPAATTATPSSDKCNIRRRH